jgi:UDP-glucose:(heptosyl)LPS alpha-1,3-glucosyltransferase
MRIALVRQRYNPFGGAEKFIERAIGALENEGAEITLFTRQWQGGRSRAAVVVDPPYAGRLWRDASFSRQVREALSTRTFDLVQSHERIPGCDLYRAGDGVHSQWLKNRQRSASLWERVGIRFNPYHWYVCAAERALFEHPALRAVICNSNMVSKEIESTFSIARRKLHVIYNGVDLVYFNPDERRKSRESARARLGCSQGDTLFSFVGSGFARKGLSAALDALAASGRRDLKLLVAGEDRSTKKFSAQAARLGLSDRVTFLGGVDDVRFVYSASDCFILPTRYDPFPNAALEALAMGVPIIVSSQCGAAEIVEQGSNGWVCSPDDAGAIARAMVEAAAVSGRLDGNARLTAEKFGIEKMAGEMIALYQTLLRKPKGETGGA